jgi:murein DD-endopeptidase MepM/ murein hydrolase activator NlpD
MAQYQTTYLNIPPKWPGALPTIPTAVITSPFGPRRPPTTSGGRGSSDHGGIDIAGGGLAQYPGGRGSPIYAVNDGEVTAINPNSQTAGKMIFIDHPGGWRTEYMHLDSILVGKGPVSKGQIIGTMGNTGNSSGTHLHFTVRKEGKKLDPLLVFGWNYKFSNPNTEQRYQERLAAGLKGRKI